MVKWLKDFRADPVTFTFHGGEPLLAEGSVDQKAAFALQTNLWKMTPELAQILAEYNILIGSNIDGPEETLFAS